MNASGNKRNSATRLGKRKAASGFAHKGKRQCRDDGTCRRKPEQADETALGEKVRKCLDDKDWSQSCLARKVGVSPAAISRIVTGGDTSTALGLHIARTLGVSADWLFNDRQPWPPVLNAAPPIQIAPWPPHGITWAEVQTLFPST